MEFNMRALPLLSLFAVVLFASYFYCSNAEDTEKYVFVSGKTECLDCATQNSMSEHPYKGLHVAIKCKTNKGEYETKATGGLDQNGTYNFQLPSEVIGENGDLEEECFAQIHNSETNTPCPQNNKESLDASKLAVKFKKNGAHFVSTSSKLPFSSETCSSKFYWLHHKKHFFTPTYKKPLLPPVPKYTPPVYKKPCPPLYKKPIPTFPPIYKKKLPHFPPIYKKAFHHFHKYPPHA